MNTSMLQHNPLDLLLNIRNCQALQCMYSDFPEMNLRAVLPEILTPNENVGFRALDNVCPPSAWVSGNGEMIIWVGGTSGQIHRDQLLRGWARTNEDWAQSYGASGAFYNAARALMTSIGPEELGSASKFYLIGHSYGGASCEALAAILRGAGNPDIRIWSYGAPRPGVYRLGNFLSTALNTRFFADNDPVRFIPPHSSESPALTLLDDWTLVRGCNKQVQPPTGYQLEADGRIVETEGNPTSLHAVALSVAQWCFDTNGFRSVNHALSNYIQRFTLAFNAKRTTVEPGTIRQREQPEELTIRQRDQIEDQGLVEVNQALSTQPNFNTEFRIPQQRGDQPLRYRRRKVGSVWGVKYGDEVVAIGPGKRKALKLARGFNRAARAGV